MNDEEFKQRFIATFLGCYAANNYTDWCVMGEHDRFNHLPVEDAIHLAGKAVDQLRAINGDAPAEFDVKDW